MQAYYMLLNTNLYVTDRFALDLEATPTCDDPSFTDPADWRPFAVVLAYEREDCTETIVITASDETLAAEAVMYHNSITWIAERLTGPPTRLLTYNGRQYDIPILEYRAGVVQRDVPRRLDLLAEYTDHIDLLDLVVKDRGHRMSIDDVLAMLRLDSDTPTWDSGRKVTGEDMLELGPRILSGDATDDELDAVKRYAASDVRPLFEVHDRLENRLQQ